VEPVGDVCHEGSFVGFRDISNIFDIKKVWNPNLLASNIERQLHVSLMIGLVQLIKINEIGSVDVEKSAEGETIIPGG